MMMVIDGVSSQASEHLKESQNDSLLILPQYADQCVYGLSLYERWLSACPPVIKGFMVKNTVAPDIADVTISTLDFVSVGTNCLPKTIPPVFKDCDSLGNKECSCFSVIIQNPATSAHSAYKG